MKILKGPFDHTLGADDVSAVQSLFLMAAAKLSPWKPVLEDLIYTLLWTFDVSPPVLKRDISSRLLRYLEIKIGMMYLQNNDRITLFFKAEQLDEDVMKMYVMQPGSHYSPRISAPHLLTQMHQLTNPPSCLFQICKSFNQFHEQKSKNLKNEPY
jgi:hypothetical protein